MKIDTVLKLLPGDVILVKVRNPLTKQQRQDIIIKFQAFFPGHTCLVFDNAADLQIVRPGTEGLGPAETFQAPHPAENL